ncbi:metallophosphoesterase [Bacteroides sp. 214]|uniref:metallophosphoesterase n=1 Tax=Bacteroides sp. 214 TaxID=2302935 RepID=UPI0013D6B1E4|nr:metallophosphoesterase [Bacteroides sp. 214]NDW12436.1 metallophosphoesterase [Bacteroides sp. 214]
MKTFQFLLMLLILSGINFYVIYRLVYMLPAILAARGTVLVVGILAFLSFFLSFLMRDILPVGIASCLYKIGTSWIVIALYFALIFLLFDIIRITGLLPIGKILHKSWIGFGGVVGFVTLVMIFGYFNYQKKDRVELNISTAKGVATGAPLKIVAISDLHLGYSIGVDELKGWIDLINKENPDVVLIAGDLIDNAVQPLEEGGFANVLKTIKAKYGVYMALGNHEYISGVKESEEFLQKTGIKVLRDEAKLINNQFYIVGRDDRAYFGRKKIWDLTDPLDKTKPIIVIDHQPFELEEVEQFNVDLQVSGHTHDGQVWPISLITKAIYEKSHGYLQKGNSHIYVTSGIGLWGGKYRIGTNSEYAVINMNFGQTH